MTQQEILEIKSALSNMRRQLDEIEKRISGESDAEIAVRQKAAWKALRAKLKTLPVQNQNDGFSGADHDKILYGGEW